jgi:DNA-binding MarR family transcriptional regulator
MAANRIDRMPTRLLSRANARAQSIRIEAFAAAGSTGYQSRLLASLADEGVASQAELSRRTGIDPSDVVAAISDLESRRLITRQRDSHDARRNVITLDVLVTVVQERFLAPLSESERRQLTRILTKLVAENDPSA